MTSHSVAIKIAKVIEHRVKICSIEIFLEFQEHRIPMLKSRSIDQRLLHEIHEFFFKPKFDHYVQTGRCVRFCVN